MQHAGDAHASSAAIAPIASTSSASGPSNALVPVTNNNINGHPALLHHQAVQGARPAILDVQDPLALQWSLAHLSSLIRKALRSIQGEDDVSSSSSSSSSDVGDDDTSSSDDAATKDERAVEATTGGSRTPASTEAHAQLQSLSSIVSNASAALNQHSKRSTSPSQTQTHQQHHHHHRADSKHDEGEGGYVRLLLNHGFDKSTAALERDIELERLRKENETLREMLAVANEVPIPPSTPST